MRKTTLELAIWMVLVFEQNLSTAVHYFELSARQGCSNGQWSLGICYQKGLGIEKDLSMAIH